MPIIYTLIARYPGVVMVENTNPLHTGNFGEIAQKILTNIPQTQWQDSKKVTFVFEGHTFNFRSSGGLMFMCMCAEADGRVRPFTFLKDVVDTYFLMFSGSEESLEGATLRSFKAVLNQKMKLFSEEEEREKRKQEDEEKEKVVREALLNGGSSDPLHADFIPEKAKKVRKELDDVKIVIKDSIEKVISRGEAIESLVDRVDSLKNNSEYFRSSSRALQQNLCWANFKMKFFIALLITFVLYVVLAGFCGATLDRCL